jgi:hypothetical protein
MLKTKIAIVTALVVGTATAAAAQNYRYHPYESYRYGSPYERSYSYDQPYYGSYGYGGYGSNDHTWSGSGPNKATGENGGG